MCYVARYIYGGVYTHGFLVCRYARSLGVRLAKVDQRLTPPSTIQLVHYINSNLVFIHNRNRSDSLSEGGKRILLDNSQVYVRFLPFVSGRVHLGRLDDSEHD